MPVDLQRKKQSFVIRLTDRTQALLDAADDLAALRGEWQALGYGSGGALEFAEADLAVFAHLDVAALNAALQSLVDLRAALEAGDRLANLQRLRP